MDSDSDAYVHNFLVLLFFESAEAGWAVEEDDTPGPNSQNENPKANPNFILVYWILGTSYPILGPT